MTNNARSVQIRHPLPGDVVQNRFNVAGIGTGFEGTVGWRLLDHAGNELAAGGAQAGGMASMGDFSFEVDLGAADVAADGTVTLEVFGDNPGLPDEGPDPGFDVNVIPLVLGQSILAGFFGIWLHTVQPGETLTSIASAQHGGESTADAIFAANRDRLSDADVIHPGQVLRVPLK